MSEAAVVTDPSVRAASRERWIRRLAVALALVPPALIGWVVYRYGVDAPYGDQFLFAPSLAHDHHVGFAELAALHNEHRILVPRLVMLGLARLTGWNIRAELAASFLLGFVLLFVLWWRMKRDDQSVWALPALSLLIFTWAQFDNWLCGWQMTMVLNAFGGGVGLALASSSRTTPVRIAGTIALGVVAQYSFANGVVYWPIAALVMWVSQKRIVPALVVLAAGAVSTGLYLIDFFGPAHQLGYGSLASMFSYVLIQLGQPVQPGAPGLQSWAVVTWRMWVAGVLAVGALLAIALTAWRSRGEDELRARTAFAVGLGAYAAASAATTSMGRVFYGIGQATSPRYVAMSMFLWIGLVALVGRLRGWRWLILPVALLALAAQPASLRIALDFAASQKKMRDNMRAGGPADYMVIDPNLLAKGLATVKAEHLSCFRDVGAAH
jgi:hypothetical protein